MDDPCRRAGVHKPVVNSGCGDRGVESVWEVAAGRVREGALLEVRQGML